MKIEFPFGGFGRSSGGDEPGSNGEAVARRHDAFPKELLDDPRKVTRTGLIAGGMFVGLLGLFAVLAPLSEAAMSQGQVVTSGDRIVIQPEASGVVESLMVTEGQRIIAGQPLVRLNSVRSGAAAEQAQAKRDALRALQARLVAERDGLNAIRWPADLLSRSQDRAVASAMASQQAIFDSQRNVITADRRIAAQQERAASARRAAAGEQLRLIQDELTGIRELYQRGYARKSQLRALERAAAQLEGDTAVTSGEVEKSALESARFESERMMQTVAQLGEVEEQLAQVDPALRVVQYDANRDMLRSPVAGRVSGVERIGRGTVLRGGQTVMEVVPDSRALVVETAVLPADIDSVRVGMPATLRFPTVNPHGRTDFEGKVVALSPAPVTGENGTQSFRARIEVADPALLRREGVNLRPGVPVSVDIRAKDRTLLDYLLSPLTDAFGNMFREQ
ncbi:HlyD family type I secretion periplasmic adaptor subunit [Altererythrobacter xixiisoli]|uniref:Membrane fusion protein (MFP) family protein n=1 Tax=Croceibacterium xixiisoli TaxID=1476466 RepID=A0A6I4U283_9SPHN|nr:HlyD family type I secretion periplasmic adaptor subunit [Croceibacterium xixiisoli]MXP00744.1 HlyD family type I secretion periplasmic adaptor subunit [Croceibacterium xixiisoli]